MASAHFLQHYTVPGYPAAGTKPYYSEPLGDCEQKLCKWAFGQDSPTWAFTILEVPWNVTLSAALQTIYDAQPDYFGSVNAAGKALEYTSPEYTIVWNPEAKDP